VHLNVDVCLEFWCFNTYLPNVSIRQDLW